MKLTTIVTTVALAATMTITGLGMQSAQAMTAPTGGTGTSCVVKSHGTNTAGQSNSRFTLNSDGTVTATFEVIGQNCHEAVTLATWQAPDADKGQPYSAQKLFASKSGTFRTGIHTLTAKLPNCFYQVDLVTGSSATGINGGPQYGPGVIKGSLHGGTQSCDTTTVVTPPVTPTTPIVVPATLAKTGASANAVIATVVATIVASTFAFRRYLVRKNA